MKIMFTIDEIKTRINQSNLSAYNQRGDQAPYPRGMANLIKHFHRFCETGGGTADINGNWSVDGVWKPGEAQAGLLFDESCVNLYRGAFARSSVDETLAPGPRGRTAIYNLFLNQRLNAFVNRLFLLSRDNPVHLVTIDWENTPILDPCKDFWNQCEEESVSPIYRSKTLSMLFPEVFVPFDTRSIKQLGIDNRAGKLPTTISWSNTVSWDNFIDAHKAFQTLCLRLMEQMPDNEGSPVRYLRELSCYSDNDDCRGMFNLISRDITDSPPPITRFIDKIFYMPGQSANAYTHQDRVEVPEPIGMQAVVYPLSGSGEPIEYYETEDGIYIRYTTMSLDLPWDSIDEILNRFFVDPQVWYHSGSSRTNPPAGSFGAFLATEMAPLSSSHVTPVAAVLVDLRLLEFMGQKPILLRRNNDH